MYYHLFCSSHHTSVFACVLAIICVAFCLLSEVYIYIVNIPSLSQPSQPPLLGKDFYLFHIYFDFPISGMEPVGQCLYWKLLWWTTTHPHTVVPPPPSHKHVREILFSSCDSFRYFYLRADKILNRCKWLLDRMIIWTGCDRNSVIWG
jgi:hypothetical protein